MATGSPFMGTLKGKLGETVAMRRNGKQVLRSYISNPKNPNSQKQQVQRMVQATAAQAYSSFKKICDHSFEGVQVGQKSMSYFMSKNMDLLRSKIEANPDGTLIGTSADFVVKGVNLPVLNPYIVAKGTLPEVQLEDKLPYEDFEEVPIEKLIISVDGGVTYMAAMKAFISSNNLQLGDWLTFCLMLRENGSTQNGQQVYRFAFVRCVVEWENKETKTDLVLTPQLSNNGFLDLAWRDMFIFTDATEGKPSILSASFAPVFNNLGTNDGQLTIVAYTVIHSRQNVGGTWQRSNAEFIIRDNWEALGITYPGNFDAALDSYAGAGQAKGTGDYVLNGGV